MESNEEKRSFKINLVSVVVVTYDSSKYVIETLDSIYEQTYENIELIISDDCSKDNTVELSKRWIENKKQRFDRLELVTSPVNTGISPNHNRGLGYCRGEWVKFVAGDDVLPPNAITDFMKFAKLEPDAKFIVGGVQPFSQTKTYEPSFLYDEFAKADADLQYKLFLMSSIAFPGPLVFFHRRTLLNIGGFDENYKFLEDKPLYYKILQNGYKFYALNKVCVFWRRHNESLSASLTKTNPFLEDGQRFIKMVVLPELLKKRMYLFYWHKLLNLIQKRPQDRLTFKYRYYIIKYIFPIIDPYVWIYKSKSSWVRNSFD